MQSPYQPPKTDPANPEVADIKLNQGFNLKQYFIDFFSLKGSYSRKEFLIAALVLFTLYKVVSHLYLTLPYDFSYSSYRIVLIGIYVLWGFAVGKRAKTVGFNMLSGFIMGVLMPIMALIFIFQEGTKDKEIKKQKMLR